MRALLVLLASANSALAGQVDFREVTITRHVMAGIVKALDKYRASCGVYPTTEMGLHPLEDARYCGKDHGQTVFSPRGKDAWGRDFTYESDGGTFRLVSLGRDGKTGGTGLDADIVVAK